MYKMSSNYLLLKISEDKFLFIYCFVSVLAPSFLVYQTKVVLYKSKSYEVGHELTFLTSCKKNGGMVGNVYSCNVY